MNSIFKRINTLVTASINDLIDRAEDPERMVKQIIREMEEHIRQAKEGVIESVASEKQLSRQVEEQRRLVGEWLEKAQSALRQDREGLARSALERKKEHERILQNLEPSWQLAADTNTRLKEQLHALESKLEEAKLKRGTLLARQRSAEARQHMERTAANFDAGKAAHAEFTRMEEKVAEIEARTEAEAELNMDHSGLEQEFMDMEVDSEVEDELSDLKKQLRDEIP